MESIATLETKIAVSIFSPVNPSAISLTRGLAKIIDKIVIIEKTIKIIFERFAVKISALFLFSLSFILSYIGI